MNNEKETKTEKLTIYDGVLAVLYLVIVTIGIYMCVKHGLGGTMLHLAILTACILGIFGIKIAKYKDELKNHLGELVFVGVMSVFSVLAFMGNIL